MWTSNISQYYTVAIEKSFSSVRSIFVNYLCNSESRCLFASCSHEGVLDISLKPPASVLEKSIAFLKCKHVSKVSQDTMEDILYIEFAGTYACTLIWQQPIRATHSQYRMLYIYMHNHGNFKHQPQTVVWRSSDVV